MASPCSSLVPLAANYRCRMRMYVPMPTITTTIPAITRTNSYTYPPPSSSSGGGGGTEVAVGAGAVVGAAFGSGTGVAVGFGVSVGVRALFDARNAGLRPIRSAARLIVVPAGAERQPFVLDEPEVLVLDRDGVHILVSHPNALLGRLEAPVVKHLFH